jgi:hypothetical protein
MQGLAHYDDRRRLPCAFAGWQSGRGVSIGHYRRKVDPRDMTLYSWLHKLLVKVCFLELASV